MSNTLKHIKENAEREEKIQQLTLATTLIGNICSVCAMMNGDDWHKAWEMFTWAGENIHGDDDWTVQSLFEFIIYNFNINELTKVKIQESAVLIVDTNNIKSPMVSLEADDGFIVPIDVNGQYYGVLLDYVKGRDNAECEYIWEIDE